MAPTRVIAGQRTKLGRTMHGIAYNPLDDEILVTNNLASAILVFPGDANGDVAPIRVIQGPRTRLVGPSALSFDADNKEIIVTEPSGRRVLVFPWDADGDVPPLRVIYGPKTELSFPVGAAVDPVRDLLVVASTSYSPSGDQMDSEAGLFIFNRTDNGNVAPRARIVGPKTGIKEKSWHVWVHGGKIFATIANTHRVRGYIGSKPRAGVTEVPPSPWATSTLGFVGVWNITDNGDVPPSAIIRGPVTQLVHPSGLALNIADGEVIATDSVRNGVFTFLVPELFGQ